MNWNAEGLGLGLGLDWSDAERVVRSSQQENLGLETLTVAFIIHA
jgi:hypothetical protein